MEDDRTILEDVQEDVGHDDGGLSEDGAAEAFKKMFRDAREGPSKNAEEGGSREDEDETDPSRTTSEDDDEPSTDDSEDEAPEGETAAEKAADPEAVLKVKVGDEERAFKVKDLARLAGQEAALTKRSQEVAQRQKEIQDQGQRFDIGLEVMTERAAARYKEYANLDFIKLSQSLSEGDLRQLKADADAAKAEFDFLSNGLYKRQQELSRQRQEARAKQIPETINALTDQASPHHIPDWSDAVYDDLRSFAVEQGVPQADIDDEVNPTVIKLVWMAQQYAKSLKKAGELKPVKTPVTTKRPAQPSQGGVASKGARGVEDARKRLRQSGSEDDAAAVFKAMWRDR